MGHIVTSRLGRIKIVLGDLLDVESGVIVHGCNAMGVMNSGVAKQVKDRYPQAFAAYRAGCDRREPRPWHNAVTGSKPRPLLPLGSVSYAEVAPYKWIVNAVVQQNYGYDGKRYVSYDAMDVAWRNVTKLLVEIHNKRGLLMPVHIPKIGATRAGGDLRVILELICAILPKEVELFLHVPLRFNYETKEDDGIREYSGEPPSTENVERRHDSHGGDADDLEKTA